MDPRRPGVHQLSVVSALLWMLACAMLISPGFAKPDPPPTNPARETL